MTEVHGMRMKIVSWHNIVDEVRYWDAIDLLRNLDDELDNARRGLANCVFCHGENFPYPGEDQGVAPLRPEIAERKGGIEIAFPELRGAKREDITVEVDDRELSVTARIAKTGGKGVLGRFRMVLPDGVDGETCHAEHKTDGLRICLKRKAAKPARRKIPLG